MKNCEMSLLQVSLVINVIYFQQLICEEKHLTFFLDTLTEN